MGGDLLGQLAKLGFAIAPVRSKSGNWIVLIDVEAVKFALDTLLLGAGVTLDLHTRLVAVHRAGERLDAITVADHRGMREVAASAKIIFMCLTDASAVEQVVFGPEGIAAADGAGQIVRLRGMQ